LNGNVSAFNATSGTPIWTQTTSATASSPAISSNGILYVGGSDGKLYALNKTTGAAIWTNQGGSSSSPAIYNSTIFISPGSISMPSDSLPLFLPAIVQRLFSDRHWQCAYFDRGDKPDFSLYFEQQR